MAQVWELPCSTHTEKLVLLALADNANDQYICWPSIETLARKTDLTEAGVRKQVKKLVTSGLLKVETGGGKKSNRYTLALNAVGGYAVSPPLNAVAGKEPLPLNAVIPNRKTYEPEGTLAAGAVPVDEPKELDSTEIRKKWHEGFIRLWSHEFKVHFGRDYVFGGGKDGSAVKRLLAATGKQPGELMEVARSAWANSNLFNCKQATTIAGLLARWNDIVTELEKLGLKKTSAPQKAGPEEF